MNPTVETQNAVNSESVTWCCRVHPFNWWHEVGCPHMEWSKEQLLEALIAKKSFEGPNAPANTVGQVPVGPRLDRYSIPLSEGRRFVYIGPTVVTKAEFERLTGWLSVQLIISEEAPSVSEATKSDGASSVSAKPTTLSTNQ